nr:MAG TPA: hypothetical protein [Caudoviricetes sp.]
MKRMRLHDNEDKILSNMTASFRAEIGKVLE